MAVKDRLVDNAHALQVDFALVTRSAELHSVVLGEAVAPQHDGSLAPRIVVAIGLAARCHGRLGRIEFDLGIGLVYDLDFKDGKLGGGIALFGIDFAPDVGIDVATVVQGWEALVELGVAQVPDLDQKPLFAKDHRAVVWVNGVIAAALGQDGHHVQVVLELGRHQPPATPD